MLEDLGAKRLSADEIVHRLLQAGSNMWQQIVEEFQEEILDPHGLIDRKKLGDIVFQDPDKRRRLEGIIHPPVLELLRAEIERFQAECGGVLVVEIPLLVETAAFGLVDKILVASAEQETQIGRLEKRYGIGRQEALLRIRSQLPMAEKIRHADWVVSTEGTLLSTKRRVGRVWREIQESLAPQL